MEAIDEVLDFWFGSGTDAAAISHAQSALWWGRSEQTDARITQRFGDTLRRARDGALDAWTETPRGRLALIVVTDQFPRNIHRGTPQAFASDAQARTLCKAGLAEQADRVLNPIECVFFYLPLEHAENILDQRLCVELFTRLAEKAPAAHAQLFAGYLDFARRHLAIIERFGRFPHRNAILGRASTAEEIAFLQTPGSSF